MTSFGLWAALLFLPAAGAVLLGAIRRRAGWPPFLLGALAVTAGLAGTLNLLSRAQPPAVDLAPLVRFLNEPAQRPYRYLTLGFGDQLARLSALTANGTPDGTYHTARQLPELRQSGLGALDMAVWSPAGPWAVYPFLNQPHRYGLRWVFSNHPAYAPVLRAAGWTYRFEVGAVQAWERAAVQPRPVPAPAEDRWAALWWGIAPLASHTVCSTSSVSACMYRRKTRAISAMIARRSDGTVLCWGLNTSGQIGDGTRGDMVDRPSPTAVMGLRDVLDVAAGATRSIARTAPDELWVWGRNEAPFRLDEPTPTPTRTRTPAATAVTTATATAPGRV